MKKHVLIKEYRQIGKTLASTNLCRKSHWSGNTETLVKKKVPAAADINEGDADRILGHEKTHHDWFP